jgi:oxepin-CoA hydrolase/3-oxo-5,6-dehydrosuberyl-CoA semialdehyde dehydrogenase
VCHLFFGPLRPPLVILAALHRERLENFLELIHFEDLPLGVSWTTRRRTITEADVAGYVGLSGDFNPLYADVVHARSGPYQGLVVPAPLIAAVVAGLGAIDVPIPHTVALVGWNWKFEAPVRPGDSILSRWRLNRKRDVEDARLGLVTWQVEVENQNGELVAMAEVVRLVARRQGTELPEPAEAAEGTGGEVAGDQVRAGRRRRRRRGGGNGGPAPESVAAPPAPEAVPAQPSGDAVAPPDAVAAPDTVPGLPLVETQRSAPEGGAPPLEPAPAPSRRRRRRRGNGNGGPAPEVPAEVPPEAAGIQRPEPSPEPLAPEPPAAAAPEEPAAKPRRPRRRRTPPPPEPVIGSPFLSGLRPGFEEDHEPPAQS